MAGFFLHTVTGALSGAAVCSTALWAPSLLEKWYLFPVSVFVAAAGSAIPDIDSENGIPSRIIFPLLACVTSGGTAGFIYGNLGMGWQSAAIGGVLAFFTVNIVLRILFHAVTKHHGAFHSIPGALCSASLVLLILMLASVSVETTFLISGGWCAGYISHLVVDELFDKRSGRTFTLFAETRITTMILYGLTILTLFSTKDYLLKMLLLFIPESS